MTRSLKINLIIAAISLAGLAWMVYSTYRSIMTARDLKVQKQVAINNYKALLGKVYVLENKEGEQASVIESLIATKTELLSLNTRLSKTISKYEQTFSQATTSDIEVSDTLPEVVINKTSVSSLQIKDSTLSLRFKAEITDSTARLFGINYTLKIPLFVAFENDTKLNEARVYFQSNSNVSFSNIEAFTIPFPTQPKQSNYGFGFCAGVGVGLAKTQEFNPQGVLIQRLKPVITPTISLGLNLNLIRF